MASFSSRILSLSLSSFLDLLYRIGRAIRPCCESIQAPQLHAPHPFSDQNQGLCRPYFTFL